MTVDEAVERLESVSDRSVDSCWLLSIPVAQGEMLMTARMCLFLRLLLPLLLTHLPNICRRSQHR
jgi:hypothetical protein